MRDERETAAKANSGIGKGELDFFSCSNCLPLGKVGGGAAFVFVLVAITLKNPFPGRKTKLLKTPWNQCFHFETGQCTAVALLGFCE